MTPNQHAAVLHPLKAEGQVFIGRKLPGPPYSKQDPYHPWELDMVLYDAALYDAAGSLFTRTAQRAGQRGPCPGGSALLRFCVAEYFIVRVGRLMRRC